MKIICGVPVSSDDPDARIGGDGPAVPLSNDAEDIAELVGLRTAHRAELVVMEAAGVYERLAFSLFWAQEVACAFVNPRAVRRFAEAMGFVEKSDRIDAGMIAWDGAVKRIAPCPPASVTRLKLHALSGRLRPMTAL